MQVTGALSVRAAAAEAPARPALVVDGAVRTWAELAADVEVAMPALATMAAPIGLIGDRRYPTLVAVYAAIELGLPIALAHPRWTPAERTRWRRLVPGTFFEVPPTSRKSSFEDISSTFREVPGTFDGENMPGTVEKSSYQEICDPERILAVLPTSGTTGQPKGVALSRRAFLAATAANADNLGWRDDDRWLLALPLAHVGGLSILVRCLTARRAVVVETAERFVPERFAATLARRRVTIVSLVPTMLRRLLDLEARQSPPSRLRAALVGGAGAAPELLADARSRGWPVLATYGLTEACSQVATQRLEDLDADDTPAAGCGPPVAGVEVRIRGGAIEVRGPTLLSRYVTLDPPPALDSPLDFALDSPLDSPLDSEGWLRTGDRGFLDDAGHLHVLGRADDAISSGGELVDPLEVERVLEAHPAIDAACVFARADPLWGHAVAAALVAREPPDDGALIAHCRARLAGFKRPRAIAYLDDLPAAPSGKVDRAAVAAVAAPSLRDLH